MRVKISTVNVQNKHQEQFSVQARRRDFILQKEFVGGINCLFQTHGTRIVIPSIRREADIGVPAPLLRVMGWRFTRRTARDRRRRYIEAYAHSSGLERSRQNDQEATTSL